MLYLRRSVFYWLTYWTLWEFAGVFGIAPHISAFYPGPALTAAFVAVFGPVYLPAVYVGIFCAPFSLDEMASRDLFDVFQVLRQTAIYGGVGWLLRSLPAVRLPLAGTGDVARSLIALVAASGLSALTADGLFVLFGVFPANNVGEVMMSFWAGDASGVIMAFPLIVLALTIHRDQRWGEVFGKWPSKETFLRWLPLVAVPMAASIAGFGVAAFETGAERFGYVIILPVVWFGAVRGLYGGNVAALVANMTAVFAYQIVGVATYNPVELQTLFAISAATGLAVGAAFDERKEVEEKAVQQEQTLARMSRLATIGELGTTIAHEISTPLQVALINVQLLKKRLDGLPKPHYEALSRYQEKVSESMNRIARIHMRLNGFAGANRDEYKAVDPFASVETSLELLDRDIRKSGAKVLALPPTSETLVIGDTAELEQVFINLVKNALRAVEGNEGRERIIKIAERECDERYLCIGVTDNGKGVPPGKQSRIFEGFFSETEGGLGVGLSICKSLLEGMGGNIRVESDGVNGSTFVVKLQKAEAETQ